MRVNFLHILIWLNLIFAIVFTSVFMQDTNLRFLAYIPWGLTILSYVLDANMEKQE